jgi:hypothetical protein
LGCPLLWPEEGGRAYVDWAVVREQLVLMGFLNQ